MDRITQLEEAIRKHRDAKGHDRCFENDLELYKLLPEGLSEDYTTKLPSKEEFLEGCSNYYQSQCLNLSKYGWFFNDEDDTFEYYGRYDVWVVELDFWNKNHCCKDQSIDLHIPNFNQHCESLFICNEEWSMQKIREVLTKFGMKELEGF